MGSTTRQEGHQDAVHRVMSGCREEAESRFRESKSDVERILRFGGLFCGWDGEGEGEEYLRVVDAVRGSKGVGGEECSAWDVG